SSAWFGTPGCLPRPAPAWGAPWEAGRAVGRGRRRCWSSRGSSDYPYRRAQRNLEENAALVGALVGRTPWSARDAPFPLFARPVPPVPGYPPYGSGSRPLQSIHAQTTAVSEPNAPATSPIVRGPTYCDAIPAAAIDTIITLQRIDSMVLNTRPRNSSGVWRSSCALLSTLVTAMPTRDSIMNPSAAA